MHIVLPLDRCFKGVDRDVLVYLMGRLAADCRLDGRNPGRPDFLDITAAGRTLTEHTPATDFLTDGSGTSTNARIGIGTFPDRDVRFSIRSPTGCQTSLQR